MDKHTTAFQILQLTEINELNVLKAYKKAGRINLFTLMEKLDKDRQLKITEVSLLLKVKGHLKVCLGGFEITNKGKLFLLVHHPSIGFWGLILTAITIVLMLMLRE